jgi:hypothetical protein
MGFREAILISGEVRVGPADKVIRDQLSVIADLDRLLRMVHRTLKASTWEEILNTP